jgi:hypothetical protein
MYSLTKSVSSLFYANDAFKQNINVEVSDWITDDLYLGLALGTALAIITFASMAFTYFLAIKLSD